MADTPPRPAGSFGCCNLLVPLATIAGGIVGFKRSGWPGLLVGVLGGFVVVVLVALTGTLIAVFGKRDM